MREQSTHLEEIKTFLRETLLFEISPKTSILLFLKEFSSSLLSNPRTLVLCEKLFKLTSEQEQTLKDSGGRN